MGEDQTAQLAFVSDRRQRGNLDIWLFDVETGQAEAMTSDDWQDASPAWSPDGQMLVFRSFKVGGPSTIRAIVLPDRAVRNLIPSEHRAYVTGFAWSGSGKSVLYTTFTELGEDDRVWWLDLWTGCHRYLTDAEWLGAVSPDDQYLSFLTREPEYNWLVFRVLRLSDNIELQPHEEQFHLSGQVWAPEGDYLAVSSGLGPQVAIYQISKEGIDKHAVDYASGDPEMQLCDLDWSPDSEKLLVVHAALGSNVCQGELLLYDASLSYHQTFLLEGLAGYPRWSRDGEWIVYGKDDTLHVGQYESNVQRQADGEIWIVESTGLNARPLIVGPAYNGQPAWKP